MSGVRFTAHALEMMDERGVAVAWVVAALEAPSRREVDPRGLPLMRSYLAVPERGGRVLRVVHRTEGATTVVITAHFDRGARA